MNTTNNDLFWMNYSEIQILSVPSSETALPGDTKCCDVRYASFVLKCRLALQLKAFAVMTVNCAINMHWVHIADIDC